MRLSLVSHGAVCDHLQCFAQFLVGGRAGGIEHLRALKLRYGALQVALFAKLQALFHVVLPGFEPRLVQTNLVVGVMGIGLAGLQEIFHSGVIILDVHGLARRLIVLLVLGAACRKHSNRQQHPNLTPSPHGLSGTSTRGNPCLSLLMESSIAVINPASWASRYV